MTMLAFHQHVQDRIFELGVRPRVLVSQPFFIDEFAVKHTDVLSSIVFYFLRMKSSGIIPPHENDNA